MKYILVFCSLFFYGAVVFGQLSPGELSSAHAHLEGLKNCTECHVLKEKQTTPKCLACHTEIQHLINQNKGYHASVEVKGKVCAECHSEHFGHDFELVRFDSTGFNHDLTTYKLVGKHARINCSDCHKTALIQNKISQKKGSSYLGLRTECLSCHTDFHQNTLSQNCIECHNQEAFRPAPAFDHQKTKFPLIGKHQNVDCIKCHLQSEKNGQKFQQFAEVKFSNCTNCHQDVHQNKFGNDCRKCHDEFSFHQVKSLGSFNHDKTNFPLKGKHQNVDCAKCHKGSYTKAVEHQTCSDCHSDYHEKQFEKKGVSPDCEVCHSIDGFSPSFYSFEMHSKTTFPLTGAHQATPCFTCHKKNEKWNFYLPDKKCVACHENIHKNVLDDKFLAENNCENCHWVSAWSEIQFNHNQTKFELKGKHQKVTCRQCHFSTSDSGERQQRFSGFDRNCEECHTDIHFQQFVLNGKNECERCHVFDHWKPEKFEHNTARFKLDGKHEGLECVKCHKPNDALLQKYIVYKFEDISCKSCH